MRLGTLIAAILGLVIILRLWGDPFLDRGRSHIAVSQRPNVKPSINIASDRSAWEVIQKRRLASIRSAGGVRVVGNDLSLDITNKPLKIVLETISKQSGIPINVSAAVPDSEVTLRFDNRPIAQCLQHLLSAYDSFFSFGPVDGGAARLMAVWVYPQEQGRALTPIPSPFEIPQGELQQHTQDPDVIVRASATAALIERSGNKALEVIMTALADPEEQVRMQALQAALHAAVDLAPGTLEDLARHDPSPTVRAIALEGLINRDSAKATTGTETWEILEFAKHDPAPEVSELAVYLIENLRNASQPTDPASAPDTQQGGSPQSEAFY